ncbi:MAG: glycoside hydrolase family 27 protein [Limnochordia bacterium]|jgi:alpha-galactosidase|nr:glycoside hydrolase family 27 protein [Bacillota bacterium]HOB08349.1 glycoside hydrolase family 27 protein [Limnochordia bacterium]NLH32071.1 glycoside hydrolase family 27 protein [Bacillota bacterium]HPT92533.1 glycoside hydrolase family 27 protein [Limnochordia bacterium]HPZ30627.1 glycoside hydrolase family 27 protein [Limnochordia bacterium]
MNKTLGMTPPMGWNSWNTFTWDINEELIRQIADTFVTDGYKDAGYEYIVIDDCWSLRERDANGNLVADPSKFPSGMKALADYIHSKGLKFGIYSCAGTHTCAGYPGSFEHEFQDAKLFAEWGVDYLKYDYCFKPRNVSGELLYKRMNLALRNCGRDILFSACNWGADNVYHWIRESGAHMYRSTGDIQDSWESIKNIALSQLDKGPFTGTFCHNDMDMLVVGMYGGSNSGFISAGRRGCTDSEYKTHFSLWCMMGSPLMIGCDIRTANQVTKDILLNQDLIAINQDVECRGAYRIKPEPQWFHSDEVFMLVKVLSNGDLAIGFFNLSDHQREIPLLFWDMGLPYASGAALSLYDCWAHKELGVFKERFSPVVPAHDCVVVRARLVV